MSLHQTGPPSPLCRTANAGFPFAMETGDAAYPNSNPGMFDARALQTLPSYHLVDFTQYIPYCSSDATGPPFVAEISEPTWVLQRVIQTCGNHMEKITEKLPNIQIIFIQSGNKIVLKGPFKQVHIAQDFIKNLTGILQLNVAMVVDDLYVNRIFHRHIIGKQGARLSRIKMETSTTIYFPGHAKSIGLFLPPDIVRIQGPPAGVSAAKEKILQKAAEMERYWALSDRIANDPEPGMCRVVLHVDKENVKHVMGRGGATIKRIQKSTETWIELPQESDDSNAIAISGKRENVDKARKIITDIVQKMPIVDHRVVNETPIPKDMTDHLKARHEEKKSLRHSETVRVNSEIFRSVIGRNCTNITELAVKHDVHILLPDRHDRKGHNAKKVTIVGSESKVKPAKNDLNEIIRELEEHVTERVKIDCCVYGHLIGAKGKKRYELQDQFDVTILFPNLESKTNLVKIRGRKENVEKAKSRLLFLATYFMQIETMKFETSGMRARTLKARRI